MVPNDIQLGPVGCQVSPRPRNRSSLWPQVQNCGAFSSTACCAVPVGRCPRGCWAHAGEPEHSARDRRVLVVGALTALFTLRFLLNGCELWSWCWEIGGAPRWFSGLPSSAQPRSGKSLHLQVGCRHFCPSVVHRTVTAMKEDTIDTP